MDERNRTDIIGCRAHATVTYLALAIDNWTKNFDTALLRGHKSSEKAEYGQRREDPHCERPASAVVISRLN